MTSDDGGIMEDMNTLRAYPGGVVVTIRDRMIAALTSYGDDPAAARDIDAILAACPEIAALDHAEHGWIAGRALLQFQTPDEKVAGAFRPVLVVYLPEASS